MEKETIAPICQQLQGTYSIPNISVAVVNLNDTQLNSFTYASSKESFGPPVTDRTIFGLGSVSKSFTSVCLSVLLSSQKFTWDTPLSTLLGDDCQFPDSFRTDMVCLRDVLAHKLGIELGETDFGYIMGNLQREEIVGKLRHLPTAAQFRTKLMYNNIVYTVAGIVAEKLTGKPYEVLMKEVVFDLLGMEDTTFTDYLDPDTHDVATPHVGIEGVPTPVDLKVHRMASSVAPAASICSSARDMVKWMRFLLNKGRVGDVQVADPRLLQDCWSPQFALPNGKLEWDGYVSKPTFPVTETRDSYGFGWYMGTYRGYRMVAHSGELFGWDCLVTLYPDMNIGIYTNTNGPGGETSFIANQLLHYYISDHLLPGCKHWLNIANISTFPEPWKSRAAYFTPKKSTEVNKRIPPNRELSVYTGKYEHQFLGVTEISFVMSKGVLHMKIGKIGEFDLHPNGGEDEFRMEGQGCLDFVHQWDLYSPSDWMTVKFVFGEDNTAVVGLYCSLFESGPLFKACS